MEFLGIDEQISTNDDRQEVLNQFAVFKNGAGMHRLALNQNTPDEYVYTLPDGTSFTKGELLAKA